MKRAIQIATAAAILFSVAAVHGQTDDVRQATGLPIPIGAPVIYGQVVIRGLAAGEHKPTVFVSLIANGVQADRTQANDRGYYYFLRSPGDGVVLVFEVSNSEIGRAPLFSGMGNSVRRDIEIDMHAVQATKMAPGVVSVEMYPRSAANNERLDKARAAVKANKPQEALTFFKQIITDDPKDFVTWTEIGSLYFANSKFIDAELAYGKALEQKPDFMPALMNVGKLYLSQKKDDMAIAAFLQAASADPTFAEAFHYLGEAYLNAKQGSNAVKALNEAIRLEPAAMAELHLRLAALYDAAGAKGQAAAEYRRFLDKRPNYADKDKLEAYIKANHK
jgi:tetratricopeptide (TPR) repeat protein